MKNQKSTGILLKRYTFGECDFTYKLFQRAMLIGNFMQHLQLHGEQPVNFANRLGWLTKGFYAIKAATAPNHVLGFSFVYKMNKSYFYGAAILPDHYDRHILSQAMTQTAELAKYCYGINNINFKLTLFTMNLSQQVVDGVVKMPQKGYTELVA